MLLSSNSGFYSFRAGQPRYPFADSIRFLSNSGFKAIDVNFSAVIYHEEDRVEPVLLGEDWLKQVESLSSLIRSLSVKVYMSHLPFFDYSKADDGEREFRFAMTSRALEASSLLGIKWAVVHPSKLDQEQGCRATCEYLDIVQKKVSDLGLGLALENMASGFGSDIEALCRLIDSRGNNLGFCFDSGHFNVAGGSLPDTLGGIGGRLKTLHLHDNFGDRDEHLAPFMGTIDWLTLAGALKKINYAGDLNFEVNPLRSFGVTDEIRENHVRYVVSAGRRILEMIINEG